MREISAAPDEIIKFLNREAVMNKYRLQVYPKGGGREIYRIMEISGNLSLDKKVKVLLCNILIWMTKKTFEG